MNLSEGFREAWDTIRHNKLRTFLTMLGMNIGVAAVIAVMSTGLMGRGAVMSGIEQIGSKLIWITVNSDLYQNREERIYLRPDDVDAMEEITERVWISPMLSGRSAVGYRGYQETAALYGVRPDYRQIWDRKVETGRFISADDIRLRTKAVVLGANTAAAFFDRPEDAVGRNVRIGDREFVVVGVMQKKERSPVDDGADDDTCYLPYEVYESMYDWSRFGGPRVFQVFFKVQDLSDLGYTTDLLQRYLDTRYGGVEDQPRFIVHNAEENIRTTNQIFDIITTVITLIAGISLLVGGIGIMNIMLVTVTERTREIGIRKAIGAKRRDILGQFLVESVIICLIGGGFGTLFGIGATILVSILQKWAYLMPWFSVALGLAVSISIGLFFGIYPATKAARLDPVRALTQE
jgi:putative ABC transport system permease protein